MTTAGVFDTMEITEQYFTYRILFYMMADFIKLKNDYLDRMASYVSQKLFFPTLVPQPQKSNLIKCFLLIKFAEYPQILFVQSMVTIYSTVI